MTCLNKLLRNYEKIQHISAGACGMQKAGPSARTEVYAIEEWERVQAEAALAKEQEEAILVRISSTCEKVTLCAC